MQAIGGHLDLMASARPVEEWLADPRTEPALRERLESARRIRAFASRHLGLPDNGSYTAYADLDRPYVVWNVFAAPRFSVEPRRECFPFTGCVAYRGFYSEDEAQRHAERLRRQGYDVHVGGVPAYSTLGWFDDPVLSTMLRWSDAALDEEHAFVAELAARELPVVAPLASADGTTVNGGVGVKVGVGVAGGVMRVRLPVLPVTVTRLGAMNPRRPLSSRM